MNDLSSWVEKNAAFTPSKTAIRFEGGDIGYARFAETIRGHARALRTVHGVERGDRVAFLGFNSPAMLALFFACARIGAMFSPLNWRLAAPELAYILGDSAPRVLIADAGHADLAREAAADYPLTAIVPVDRIARDAETAEGEDRDAHAGPETPCLLVYTSGTTGQPKGRGARPAGDPGQRPQLRPLCRADRRRPRADRVADVPCRRAQHPDFPPPSMSGQR